MCALRGLLLVSRKDATMQEVLRSCSALFSLSLIPVLLPAYITMHPPPSPQQICPFSDAGGLGGGCIQLNGAAALERTP